jgi:hypothetical protein
LWAFQRNDHPVAIPHDVFVDRIIHYFLYQDIDPVIVVGSISDAADVHPGAFADVFERGE